MPLDESLTDLCPFCGESVDDHLITRTIYTPEGPRPMHRECALRETIGGIGHLIAHDYWCTERHDPDAGLTRRQSALLVDTYVAVVGIQPVGGDR